MWNGFAKTLVPVGITLGIVGLWQGRSLEKVAHADAVYSCRALGTTADLAGAIEGFARSCQTGTLALLGESQHSYGAACCVTK